MEGFPAIMTLMKSFILFFQIVEFGIDSIRFSGNSLLSLINSVCFDIRLSCSFLGKSISFSLVIFSNCFVVRMLLPTILILLTISRSILIQKTS